MRELFLSILNMSLTASYIIIFVILIRLSLKKAPKVISYALWGVVAFRLIIPFSFESIFSLLPRDINTVAIPQDIVYQQNPQINSGIESANAFINGMLPAPTIGASVNSLQIYIQIGTYIWVLGMMALLVYSLVSILLLRRQLKNAQLAEQNIYEAENLKTPFVLGFIRPKIYLPVGLDVEEKRYILLHEQTHIHRYDHIIKPFAFLILSIHWFNPLVWIAFMLMSMDMELSCDERVLKEMDDDIKKPYATSLLSLATGKHILNGSPLAFGEGNVKGRIKNVLNYKKPTFWVATVVVIAVTAVGIGLISNPRSNMPSMAWAKSLQTEDIQSIELIVQPSSEQGYKKYDFKEFPEIVRLVNQSSGRLIKNPENIAGSAQTFYITTKDGVVHRFTNNGNAYLVIDGDAFEARYEWLSMWKYKCIGIVPDGFWKRVESGVSNATVGGSDNPLEVNVTNKNAVSKVQRDTIYDKTMDLVPTTFETVNDFDGVTMTVKKGTAAPTKLTVAIRNNSSSQCTYGEYFDLEKKINEIWYKVPVTIDSDYGFNSIGYDLSSGDDREWAVDWNWLYGSLEPGEYRIIKDILDFRGTGDYDTYYLAAEFTIN